MHTHKPHLHPNKCHSLPASEINFLISFFFPAMSCGLWGLSSPTKDPTRPLSVKVQNLNH